MTYCGQCLTPHVIAEIGLLCKYELLTRCRGVGEGFIIRRSWYRKIIGVVFLFYPVIYIRGVWSFLIKIYDSIFISYDTSPSCVYMVLWQCALPNKVMNGNDIMWLPGLLIFKMPFFIWFLRLCLSFPLSFCFMLFFLFSFSGHLLPLLPFIFVFYCLYLFFRWSRFTSVQGIRPWISFNRLCRTLRNMHDV